MWKCMQKVNWKNYIFDLRWNKNLILIVAEPKVWDIGTKYLMFWYQFFTCWEELVKFFHRVITEGEICGST